MVLFWWLLFAHLLADFPLQVNRVYTLKLKSFWGVVLHASIFGIVALIVSAPYWLVNPYNLLFIIVLWSSHIYIDRTKLLANNLTIHKTTAFFLDQILHISLIFLVCSFPLVRDTQPMSNQFLNKYYYNADYINLITAYLVTTYVALVVKLVIREGRLHPESKKFQMPPMKKKYWEMGERASITTAVWLGGYFYFILIFSAISIWLRYRKRVEHECDLCLSTLMAITVGIALRIVI
jgi:hypothetical protein